MERKRFLSLSIGCSFKSSKHPTGHLRGPTALSSSSTKLCLLHNAVYQITCNDWNQYYIGSTTRFIQDRVKEHVKKHISKCQNKVYNSIEINTITYKQNTTVKRLTEESNTYLHCQDANLHTGIKQRFSSFWGKRECFWEKYHQHYQDTKDRTINTSNYGINYNYYPE